MCGVDNVIAGRIKGKSGDVGDISGKWNEVMEIQRKNVRSSPLVESSLD